MAVLLALQKFSLDLFISGRAVADAGTVSFASQESRDGANCTVVRFSHHTRAARARERILGQWRCVRRVLRGGYRQDRSRHGAEFMGGGLGHDRLATAQLRAGVC
jgi:hypothetical protein